MYTPSGGRIRVLICQRKAASIKLPPSSELMSVCSQLDRLHQRSGRLEVHLQLPINASCFLKKKKGGGGGFCGFTSELVKL